MARLYPKSSGSLSSLGSTWHRLVLGLSYAEGPGRHLCWVIRGWFEFSRNAQVERTTEWPETSGPLRVNSFRDALKQFDADGSPSSWLVPFEDASQPRLALVAPCAQLVRIPFVPLKVLLPPQCTVPLKPDTNIAAIKNSLHKTYSDCYEAPGFTGGYWGTADAYAETPLFWVEINKLMPHMSGGSADYYTFVQQLDQ
ncbi:hypothetical protein C8R45DRAFT_949067 [Mycena sanguinolenta]|nr:hypothetical protein C8R45DRAFT_949067 [Mycena sanguinolenta]